MRKIILFVSLFVWCTAVRAMIFELPVLYEELEIGYVATEVDGNRVLAIEAQGLADALGDRIDEASTQQLQEMTMVSVEELADMGIEVSFRPQTLDLVLRLSSDVFGTSVISFDPFDRPRGTPAEVASWSFLNNFTFGAEQDIDESRTRGVADWLGSMNIGGINGVNLQWTVSADHDSLLEETDVYRGEVLAFYDMPAVPLRLAAGDVVTQPNGHLSGVSLGGVSLSTSYFELQPTRRISPGTQQQLVVRERAEVEIYVNGRALQRMRLAPGRYELADLPLGQGANEVEVFLYYASGEYEVQRFSQFYNAELLHPGIMRTSLAVGYRPEITRNRGIEYADDMIATGFIERGMFRWLTLGVSGQTSDYGDMYGVNSILSSPLGNLSLRYSVSDAQGVDGTAMSAEWQHRVFGALPSGAPNIRVAYDRFEDFNNAPWLPSRGLDGERWLASYSAYLTENFELRFTYQDNQTRPGYHRNEEEVRAVYRWRRLRVGAGVRRGNMYASDTDEFEAFLTVDFNLFNAESGHRLRASHNSIYEQTMLEAGRVSRDVVGDLSYLVGHINDPNSDATYGNIDYTGNRGRLGAYAQHLQSDTGDRSIVGAQVNTALGWADGHFGWGRSGRGPFTLVSAHDSLEGAPVLVNESRFGAEAVATKRAGALVTSRARYRPTSVVINVPEAPLGYDWGSGQYSAVAGAVTGTLITVGSEAFYSVLGVLVDENDIGLELAVGRLEGEDISMTIFTNRSGRFVAEGLKPGTYRIQMTQQPRLVYEVHLPEGAETFSRIGRLSPVRN